LRRERRAEGDNEKSPSARSGQFIEKGGQSRHARGPGKRKGFSEKKRADWGLPQ